MEEFNLEPRQFKSEKSQNSMFLTKTRSETRFYGLVGNGGQQRPGGFNAKAQRREELATETQRRQRRKKFPCALCDSVANHGRRQGMVGY